MRITCLLVLVSGIALAGCRERPAPVELSSADVAAIRATSQRWLAAVRQGRWEEAAATYTGDAILWFGDNEFTGRAAILASLEAQQPLPTLELHIDEIRGRGDMAFVSGYSTVTPVGGAPVVAARYMDIRLRQPDGSWLFYRDMVSPVPASENKFQ